MAKNLLDMNDTTSYFDKKDIESNKFLALLSYISILWLLPLLLAKNSRFAQFHANQGIMLTIFGILVGIVGWVLGFIPYVGGVLGWLLGLIPLLIAIIGILNAVQGKAKELPLIGSYRVLK